MNDLIINIISVVVTTILLPLLTYCGARLSAYLNAKIKNEKYKKLLDNGVEAVTLAVAETLQVYVDTLKKNGSFDEKAQKEAFRQAKIRALQMINDDVMRAIETNFGDFDAWIDAQIECKVKELKEVR